MLDVDYVTVARNYNCAGFGCETADRVEPRNRKRVTKARRSAFLYQVAGEGDIVSVENRVAVGMPPSEI
jgi:hypothetical protein